MAILKLSNDLCACLYFFLCVHPKTKARSFIQESSVYLHGPTADVLNFPMHLNTPTFKFNLAIVWLVDAF